jgi:hypothetical protein
MTITYRGYPLYLQTHWTHGEMIQALRRHQEIVDLLLQKKGRGR